MCMCELFTLIPDTERVSLISGNQKITQKMRVCENKSELNSLVTRTFTEWNTHQHNHLKRSENIVEIKNDTNTLLP